MKKVKQIKKALPLLLVMVMFVTATLPVYAAGTVSYEYNWEGQKEVAYEGITVTDTAGNELTLETEDGTTNNYVLLTNTSGAAANIQADISGIDPSKNIAVEIALQRNGNMPPMEIRLSGMDAEGGSVDALIFYELSNSIRNLNAHSTKYSGHLTGNGWKNIGLILNTTNKTVALYMYDADSQSYVHKADIGTYDAEFATLTNLVVGCEETTTQQGRTCGIDNIRVYNGSDFATESQSVASIGGVAYYTSFEAAVNAAEANDIIKLEADVNLPENCDYNKAVTYDLNGHTLTGDAFEGNLVKVADSSNGEGLLAVLKDGLSLVSDNAGYMPVWDNTNSGYRFAKVTIEDRNVDNTGDELVFSMRPSFGSDAIEQLVAEGYETGMVRVGVRITWTDPGTQEEKTQDLALNDNWLSKMYSNPSEPKGVKLTISGGEAIKNFTATTIVWSNLSTTCPNMEITGKEYKYPATAGE